MDEAGELPDYEVVALPGVTAPKALPPPVLAKYNDAINPGLKGSELVARIEPASV